MPDNILTVAEVAEYLRVHPSTIYKLLKARKIPAFKIGSDYRFNRERIDEWRAAQEKSSRYGQPPRDEKAARATRPPARR